MYKGSDIVIDFQENKRKLNMLNDKIKELGESL